MITKKLLNLLILNGKMGPSLVSGLLLLMWSPASLGMCEFPHNPAVYCTTFDAGEVIMTGGGQCKIRAKIKKLFRPKNVYSFDESLNRVDHNQETPMSITKPYEDIHTDVQTCLVNTGRKDVVMAIKLNCTDENANIPNQDWVQIPIKGPVVDPWTKNKVEIDCSFLRY